MYYHIVIAKCTGNVMHEGLNDQNFCRNQQNIGVFYLISGRPRFYLLLKVRISEFFIYLTGYCRPDVFLFTLSRMSRSARSSWLLYSFRFLSLTRYERASW